MHWARRALARPFHSRQAALNFAACALCHRGLFPVRSSVVFEEETTSGGNGPSLLEADGHGLCADVVGGPCFPVSVVGGPCFPVPVGTCSPRVSVCLPLVGCALVT